MNACASPEAFGVGEGGRQRCSGSTVGLESNLHVGSALVHMDAKNGSVDNDK